MTSKLTSTCRRPGLCGLDADRIQLELDLGSRLDHPKDRGRALAVERDRSGKGRLVHHQSQPFRRQAGRDGTAIRVSARKDGQGGEDADHAGKGECRVQGQTCGRKVERQVVI